MKKFIALLIVLTFVIGIPGAVVAKVDQENANQFCKANNNMGYNNLGRCVRVYTACYRPGNMEAVCVCETYQSEDSTGFYTEYNNLAECISFQRDGYVHE